VVNFNTKPNPDCGKSRPLPELIMCCVLSVHALMSFHPPSALEIASGDHISALQTLH